MTLVRLEICLETLTSHRFRQHGQKMIHPHLIYPSTPPIQQVEQLLRLQPPQLNPHQHLPPLLPAQSVQLSLHLQVLQQQAQVLLPQQAVLQHQVQRLSLLQQQNLHQLPEVPVRVVPRLPVVQLKVLQRHNLHLQPDRHQQVVPQHQVQRLQVPQPVSRHQPQQVPLLWFI